MSSDKQHGNARIAALLNTAISRYPNETPRISLNNKWAMAFMDDPEIKTAIQRGLVRIERSGAAAGGKGKESGEKHPGKRCSFAVLTPEGIAFAQRYK